jgi:hypothetical protein
MIIRVVLNFFFIHRHIELCRFVIIAVIIHNLKQIAMAFFNFMHIYQGYGGKKKWAHSLAMVTIEPYCVVFARQGTGAGEVLHVSWAVKQG